MWLCMNGKTDHSPHFTLFKSCLHYHKAMAIPFAIIISVLLPRYGTECVPPMKMSSEKNVFDCNNSHWTEISIHYTALFMLHVTRLIATPTDQHRSAVPSSAASFCLLCHPNREVHSWSWVENMFLQALFLKGAQTYCIISEATPSSMVAMNYFS